MSGRWYVSNASPGAYEDTVALCEALNKAAGYPKRGTDVHGNPVGPKTYSKGAYGWTAPYEPIPDDKNKRWAVAIARQDIDAVTVAKVSTEKTKVLDAASKASDLPADWSTS